MSRTIWESEDLLMGHIRQTLSRVGVMLAGCFLLGDVSPGLLFGPGILFFRVERRPPLKAG